MTPEQNSAMARLGGITTSIRVYDAMLSGERPIGRRSAAMAMYEGRDYLGEILQKRKQLARLRLKLATAAQRLGLRLKRIAEYRRAARALDEPSREIASRPQTDHRGPSR